MKGWNHLFSWERFDDAAKVVKRTKNSGELRERTRELVRILKARSNALIDRTSDEDALEAMGPTVRRITTICEEHNYRLGEWDRELATSPRSALVRLLDLCRALHPPPDTLTCWTDVIPRDPFKPLIDADGVRKHVERHANRARTDLARVVEELHVLGASTLSYRIVVERFEERSVWFDKTRLRAIAADDDRGGTREDRLTLELAKYLHDNGILVFARPRIGTLEPDIVGVQGLAVEAKAYETDARADIVHGYYQLHAYMTSLETSAIPVREGFLVAFRLDGPIYDTPRSLMVGRYLIHALTVDLGLPRTSGRHQPRVEPITEREILDGVRAHAGAVGAT